MVTTPTKPPQEYFAAGQLMAITQLGVPTIRQVLAERGHQPAFYLNGVDHYDGAALLELRAFLREGQA